MTPDQAKKQAENDRIELGRLMADDLGLKVLMRLLDDCQLDRDPYVENRTDLTTYLLGIQSIGRKLVERFNAANPERYHGAMLKRSLEKRHDRGG